MNRRNLLKKLPSCLLGALFVAGVTSTTVNAVDGTPYLGLFELDGNIVDLLDSTVPIDPLSVGHDWESLHTGVGLVGTLPSTMTDDPDTAGADIVVADLAPKSIFTQGGSKDVSDVSKWKHTDGSVPDKDDITNAYAAAYTNPNDFGPHKQGDLIVYFGLDRYANNGDANAGFWFFQNEVKADPATGTFVDAAGNPAVHVAKRDDPASSDPTKLLPGDVFVIVKYPQGSTAVPIIKVYEWDPLDVDGNGNVDPDENGGKFSPLDRVSIPDAGKCDQAGSALVCAITNLEDLPAPPAGWNYTPKDGSGVPFESFYEGGINMTQVLGSTPCFASFLAETRSSESQTAQLKDFVLASFPVCGIEVDKICEGNLNTAGTGVDVTFEGDLKNTGAASYIAYLEDTPSGADGTISDAKIDLVCVDTNPVPGCADDDPIPLTAAGNGVYFPLGGGAVVHYEGSYTVTGLPPLNTGSDPLNDVIKAEAYGDVLDIGDPGLVIVDDSADASCSYAVEPKLLVYKECTMAFLGGDHVDVTISGWVKNDGNVPLSNVTLTDTVFGALEFQDTLGVNSGEVHFEVTDSVPYSALNPLPSAPDANGVVTVSLIHEDKVTATGQVLDNIGGLIEEKANFATASCPGSFTTGIDVQKNCTVALDFDAIANRIVVRVDVTATVTNLGSEKLNAVVLEDVPAVTFSGGSTQLAAAGTPGDHFTATGSYFPGTTIDGDNPSPGLASFTDTVDVTANGAFSVLSASDENTAICDLCPD